MRGTATQAMPDIVEDPELRSGRAPSGCGPQALAHVHMGDIDSARDRHTAPGIARSRLASGYCGTQPCEPAAKCEFISARALSLKPTEPCHGRRVRRQTQTA